MAEAIVNHLARERGLRVRAISAGSDIGDEINPIAGEAMLEIGVSMDQHKPKLLTGEMVDSADRIVTMGCGIDAAVCPGRVFVSEDWGLEDPHGQNIEAVRVIRDKILAKVEALLESLTVGEVFAH